MTRPPMVLITRGLPGSGKTTWAHRVRQANPKTLAVSLDDLRRSLVAGGNLHADGFDKGLEETAKRLQDETIMAAVDAGRDIIVHNTNLFAKGPNRIRRLVELDADIFLVPFEVDVDTCRLRNLNRTHVVPDSIMDRMIEKDEPNGRGGFKHFDRLSPDEALEWLWPDTPAPVDHPQVPFDSALPSAAIVDLDGTLAIHQGRSPYDAARCGEDLLSREVAMAAGAFDHVLLCSGREEVYRPQTEAWLEANDFASLGSLAGLWMRPAGDRRPDSVVKREIFDAHIRGRYNISAVFDDRDSVVRMWRKIGLPVWQVAEGHF